MAVAVFFRHFFFGGRGSRNMSVVAVVQLYHRESTVFVGIDLGEECTNRGSETVANVEFVGVFLTGQKINDVVALHVDECGVEMSTVDDAWLRRGSATTHGGVELFLRLHGERVAHAAIEVHELMVNAIVFEAARLENAALE